MLLDSRVGIAVVAIHSAAAIYDHVTSLGERSNVELHFTLKATTATSFDCESESASDQSLWSPNKAIAMEVGP